jgi:hypothetical protein
MPKKQSVGHCGGNHESRVAWGQGLGATQAAATAAAKADFANEVKTETAWLEEWAERVVCPHACRYKIVLPIRKANYHMDQPYWSPTKKAYIVDILEDYSRTVQCFPLKREDHER